MYEYSLAHFHVGKYKKEAKMYTRMTRELRKAAKGKQNDVRCTIEQDMVVFENRKEKIIRSYIVNVRRNRKHRIIVVATKAWKRQPGQIFAMKFSNDDDFHEFFEILMEAARSEETRRPEQKWRSPYLNFINLFPRDSTVSDYENLLTPPPLKEKRNSVAFSLPRSSYTPTPHTPVQKIHHTRSSFTQTSSLPMLPISMDAATYVTTDVLVKHGHSSSSNSSGSVSAKDVYTKEEKITKRKDKDHTEMKLLTYEPNKVNENLYSISNRSAFTSASSSSSSLPSPSTSTMDSIVKNNLAQILRNNLLNNIFSCKRSGCSSSSDSSSSSYSTPSSTIRVERGNVWKYRNHSAADSMSSSTDTDINTMDKPIVSWQSRSPLTMYVMCPICQHRSRSMARRQWRKGTI